MYLVFQKPKSEMWSKYYIRLLRHFPGCFSVWESIFNRLNETVRKKESGPGFFSDRDVTAAHCSHKELSWDPCRRRIQGVTERLCVCPCDIRWAAGSRRIVTLKLNTPLEGPCLQFCGPGLNWEQEQGITIGFNHEHKNVQNCLTFPFLLRIVSEFLHFI